MQSSLDSHKLYRTSKGIVVEASGCFYRVQDITWDDLFNVADLYGTLQRAVTEGVEAHDFRRETSLPPIGGQEVWAAGVTYKRSVSARMSESEETGGGSFYDRVYSAERPELFFKATPHRVVGSGEAIRIRGDSTWSVPEPELALAINARGRIVGYTIGNDVSSRDIEGENPLYLPQAKLYDQCCALGPSILVSHRSIPPETVIHMDITRNDVTAFEGSTTLSKMKRSFEELVAFLFRDNSFPLGCFLLTGTGIVPPDSFALQVGDQVRITIEPIGALTNCVVRFDP